MGLFDRLWRAEDEGAVLTLDSIQDHYQIVDRVFNPTYGEAVIVTEKGRRVRGREAARKLAVNDGQLHLGEIGSAGTRWRRLMGGEEYNATLAGKSGLEIYDKMRRGDASVRAALRLAKTPVLAARWSIDAGNREDPESVKQAEFIEKALFEYMSISWEQILMEAMLMLDFGYYMFELVFEPRMIDGTPRMVWQKWAPRHPTDVESEGWEYDEHGGPEGVWMTSFEGEEAVFIPIEKLIVFTYDREANNMEGISILRSAYKHWYFKDNLYKIDAIQKERHGIGVPVIKLPPGFTRTDKGLADELGRNLRTNEQAHVVLPPYWELIFAKVEGQPTNPVESINHHDKQIAKNILVQFLDTGAAASKEQEIALYMKAIRFTADIVRSNINKHAIPQLVDMNFSGVTDYPVLKARRIGEVDELRTLSFAYRNFVGSRTIVPDDVLEAWVRDEMDMPIADTATARPDPSVLQVEANIEQTEAEQSATGGTPRPPNDGSPRQGPPSAKQGQGQGTDSSGKSGTR